MEMRKTGRPSESSLDRLTPASMLPMVRQLRLILSGYSSDIRMLFDLTKAIQAVKPAMTSSTSEDPIVPVQGDPGTPGADGAPGPPGTSSVDAVAAEDILAGQPVYPDQVTGQFRLADAAFLTKSGVVGLAAAHIAASFVGSARQLMLTLADWTAVTGAVSLTPGATYFLDVTPGKLTTTAPTTVGQTVTRIGKALNDAQTMAIALQEPIFL